MTRCRAVVVGKAERRLAHAVDTWRKMDVDGWRDAFATRVAEPAWAYCLAVKNEQACGFIVKGLEVSSYMLSFGVLFNISIVLYHFCMRRSLGNADQAVAVDKPKKKRRKVD